MKRVAQLVASSGGLGYAPFAAGTFGTLAGIPCAVGIDAAARVSPLLALPAVVFLVALAIWAAGEAAAHAELKDPSVVVIDEVAGYVVTVAFLPAALATLVAGFVVFRALDIAKPPPIGALEKLPGGIGIVADDLAAGLLANVLLRVVMAVGWL